MQSPTPEKWLKLSISCAAETSAPAKPYVIIRTWEFPEMGLPQNRWLKMDNPILMDDLGVPPIYGNPDMLKVTVIV